MDESGSLRKDTAQVIAALYVAKDGAYYGLKDVDPWDETRDARLYDGPWRVVAHPPARGIEQLSQREAKATPLQFRDLLLSIARSAEPIKEAA